MPGSLEALGWNDARAAELIPYEARGLLPARVITQHRAGSVVATADAEFLARASGRMRHEAEGPAALPAPGDWVAIEPLADGSAIIHAVLDRTSAISRKVAGHRTDEQVLAANVDVVLVADSLNHERIVNRLERYLMVAWDSGARPIVVLTKADLIEDPSSVVAAIEATGFGIPVIVTSVVEGRGVDEVAGLLAGGLTGVILGPSGVGKSSITNALAGGDVQAVEAIRDQDGRGRHTTTARELVTLPGGGALIDTPGLREVQLWGGGGLDRSFADIVGLIAACRFNDCAHRTEPGCAVRAALDDGSLDAGRWERYGKIERELAYVEGRRDESVARNAKRRWKAIAKAARARPSPKR